MLCLVSFIAIVSTSTPVIETEINNVKVAVIAIGVFISAIIFIGKITTNNNVYHY